MDTDSYSKRKKYLVTQVGEILGMGFVYYIFTQITGLYIPCPFRLLTGLKCPGCGMTHYVIAMLHGNLTEAYAANQLLFWLVPALLLYGVYRAVIYLKEGKTSFSNLEAVILFITVMITLGYGVYRNIA